MNVSEEINEWIAKYGNERDALNHALAQLQQAHTEIKTLKETVQMMLESSDEGAGICLYR